MSKFRFIIGVLMQISGVAVYVGLFLYSASHPGMYGGNAYLWIILAFALFMFGGGVRER